MLVIVSLLKKQCQNIMHTGKNFEILNKNDYLIKFYSFIEYSEN